MRKLQIPLLGQLVIALLLMGLLPLGISFFQLREQARVVESQAKSYHLFATRTMAQRVHAYTELYKGVCDALSENPAVAAGLRDQAMADALTGTVASSPGVLAAGLFTPDGETVLLAQRFDLSAAIGPIFGALPENPDNPLPELLVGSGGGRMLRLKRSLPENRGFVALVADAAALEKALGAKDVSASFEMLLVDNERRVLAGGDAEQLERFPQEVYAGEIGAAGAWSRIFRSDTGADGKSEEFVAGRAQVADTPWLVISRQSAVEAEQAKSRLRRVGLAASALALLLTLGISAFAFLTVIRPLRRLVEAQRAVTGQAATPGASEIAQLEESFAILRQRVEDEAELGDVFLGRYQVTELVGSGAMGSVFRGWDPKLKRAVALKTIHLMSEDVNKDKLLGSLRDEAAISAGIHQENIVTVYDIEDRGNTAFIAMEYVEGVNLRVLLRKRRRLHYADAIPIGAALARGLATAHDHFLVHHDVKPANLLLGFDGSVKLTDFGVSQSLSNATQKTDVICGTPGYLAPECFEGRGYTPSSDVWACGVLLWEAVAGYNPFRGSNLRSTVGRTMSLQLESLTDIYDDVPKAFSDLVDRLLVKDPAERPSDCSQVAVELEALCTELDLTWVPDFSDIVEAPKKKKEPEHAPTEWVPFKQKDDESTRRV